MGIQSLEIHRDRTKSWFWMADQHSLQQMFAPGMAADNITSITDNLMPAAWTWRSSDINRGYSAIQTLGTDQSIPSVEMLH